MGLALRLRSPDIAVLQIRIYQQMAVVSVL